MDAQRDKASRGPQMSNVSFASAALVLIRFEAKIVGCNAYETDSAHFHIGRIRFGGLHGAH